MSDRSDMSPWDSELVLRALDDRRAYDGDPVSESQLAGYLDGSLSEAESSRVEEALAASPELLDLLLAARDGLAGAADEPPASVVRRAQALVGTPAGFLSALHTAFEGFADAFAPLPRPLGLALAGMLLLLVSATGFELGRTGYGQVDDRTVEQDDLLGLPDEIL